MDLNIIKITRDEVLIGALLSSNIIIHCNAEQPGQECAPAGDRAGPSDRLDDYLVVEPKTF